VLFYSPFSEAAKVFTLPNHFYLLKKLAELGLHMLLASPSFHALNSQFEHLLGIFCIPRCITAAQNQPLYPRKQQLTKSDKIILKIK
jgi:hypothetical protein